MNITMIMFVLTNCTRSMLQMLDDIVSDPEKRRIVKRPRDEATMNALHDRGLVNIDLIKSGTYEVRLHDSTDMAVSVLRQMVREEKFEKMAKECSK
jgi:hypothetical protein